MNALNVTLSDDGAFEITSQLPGKRDFRIIHDGAHDCHPWKVVSELGGSGIWREEDSFQNLDEAMDWAVSLSTETFPAPGYGVTLPCGTFFSRPGRVKIEDVMASIGWVYVVSVDGYSPAPFPKNTNHQTVKSYFEDLVSDTAAILGSVDPEVDDADESGMVMWIADIKIPVYGFIRTDRAQAMFLDIFEQEGIPSTNSFDYTTRINVVPHAANVIQLDDMRALRGSPITPIQTASAEAGR